MKKVITLTLFVSLIIAARSFAETKYWAGLGADNEWSTDANWTNASGTAGAPGATDDAVFSKDENDDVAITAPTTINSIILGKGGMSITGDYTLTISASSGYLGQAGTAYGGSVTIDSDISLPNASVNTKVINWSQTLTFNGDVTISSGVTAPMNMWGTSHLIFNGSLVSTADVEFYHQADGDVTFATQPNPPVNDIILRQGTYIFAGDYRAPGGSSNHRIGFKGYDGTSPRNIHIASTAGTSVFSNDFLFNVRGNSTKYQEFRVKAPTTYTKLTGLVRVWDVTHCIVENGITLDIAGNLQSEASGPDPLLSFEGSGTTELTKDDGNSYSGTIILSNGTMRVSNTSGSALDGDVIVCNGATFGGAGSTTAALTNETGGTIAPGASIGTLTAGSAVFEEGSVIDWELNGPTADLLAVSGLLDISAGSVTVKVHGTCGPLDTNPVFSYGTLVGTTSDLVLDLSDTTLSGGIINDTGTGIAISGLVPEPSLIGIALLAGIAFLRRK